MTLEMAIVSTSLLSQTNKENKTHNAISITVKNTIQPWQAPSH